MTTCIVCESANILHFRAVDEVDFLECRGCGSLFADPAFLDDIERGVIKNYQHGYWEQEAKAAFDRSYGASLQRIAETLILCRIPVRHFVDIGTGPGFLLDAIATALPLASDAFYGVELYPPEPSLRSKHRNYTVGRLDSAAKKFDAGVCIEVIEHLTPAMLDALARDLASVSTPGALYLFNSGQPEFVKEEDPSYLDPLARGHIVSYSTHAASIIFGRHGFSIAPFPGRRWALLAEFGASMPGGLSRDSLERRLWSPLPENVALLTQGSLGSLLYCAGRDGARCDLQQAAMTERTAWARSLEMQIAQSVAAHTMLGRLRRGGRTLLGRLGKHA